jgi:hypothetical protein
MTNKFVIQISADMERRSRQTATASVERELMRQGIRMRSATFADRKKESSKKACRGKYRAGE